MFRKFSSFTGFVFTLVLVVGCSGAYYNAMEGLGIEKRDILVDRVEDARDAQDSASEQFSSLRRWTSSAARSISMGATWKRSLIA